jgi:predicted N-acetyltransferase YhbS
VNVEIKPLASASPPSVEALLDAAFGPGRHMRTAYRLREGVGAVPGLSFAAYLDGALVGTLQSWPVCLHADDGQRVPLVMVGPVAVAPDVQRGGIGRALMDALIAAAHASADGAMMMIGDPEYYGRFWGFADAATAGWRLPGPVERHRLLARAANGHQLPAVDGDIGPDRSRGVAPAAA